MPYEVEETVHLMRVYHSVEKEARDFLSITAYAAKNKEHRLKSAERTLKAIEACQELRFLSMLKI